MNIFRMFYDQANKMEAIQYREMLDIAVSPAYKIDYYKAMRSHYNSMIYKVEKSLPPEPPSMHLDAASKDTREVMFGLFRAVKRGMGYGG